MVNRKRISNEDMALFRDAVGPVARIRQDKIGPARHRPVPVPKKTLENRQQVLVDSLSGNPGPGETETGEELSFIRPGYQYKLLRKLRRGQFSIGAELDLHGMTALQARERLSAFLKECRDKHVRCVRIVHGKGRGSYQGRPVLKSKLDLWLRLRDEVVAFSSAPPADGGTGAAYVLIKDR